MKLFRLLAAAATVAVLSASSSSAHADAAPPDPCEGMEEGAACVLDDGREGSCYMNDVGLMECMLDGAPSATGATTGGSTTGGSTTGGAGGGGGDDGGAGGGASGGATEDDGCAVQAPGSRGATRAGAGLVFVIGALVASRRWLRRGAGAPPRA